MRDESEIQEMADKIATVCRKASPSAPTIALEAMREALDWVLDEDADPDLIG